MSDSFYRAFEEKYRGSRELIKSRLQVYLPFVQPLLKAYPADKVLDLGCGRGEWLELMVEQGFDALGVDLDDGMLQACRERNLKVETADAVAYMQGLPESSLCVVSGFHIAEHLPFKVLQQLVQQALRVLVPGGLLILETPNPENISVSTCSFYLDPTHQRPIPPELLSFLPEHYGFARFRVMRMQESVHLHADTQVGLLDVLNGVSPDYAVVAQKQGVPLLMDALTPAFDQSHGLTLHDLAQRHERAVDKRLMAIEAKAQQAQEQARQAEAKAQQAQEQARQAEAKAQEALTAADLHEAQHHAFYNSISWWSTVPLRWLIHQSRLLRAHGFKQRGKAAVNKVLRKFVPWTVAEPKLKNLANQGAYKFGMAERLKPFSSERQLLVDISSLVAHDHRTGIQRVVRSVLKEWLLDPPKGFRVEPVYATVEQGYRYAKCFRAQFMDEPSIETQDALIDYSQGDIFLGLDLNHHLPVIHQHYLAEMYRNGVEVKFVVYDLLPLQFPEFWPPEHAVHRAHYAWLSVVASLGGAICISKAVADDLADWIKHNGTMPEGSFSIDWFHLGADINHDHSTKGLPVNTEATLALLCARPTFLVVGTLEPRKGHTQVLDAFDQIWKSGIDVNLAIVGKQGWMVENLVARLRNHPQANYRLLWLEGISDEYLEKVYASSTCLIAASYGEGFGLPLIEAAQHSLPIIARDIPVFREVAGEYAYYFNANDAQELTKTIVEWLELQCSQQHPDSINMQWVTWRQSAHNLAKILVR